jgi:hypothetical protein
MMTGWFPIMLRKDHIPFLRMMADFYWFGVDICMRPGSGGFGVRNLIWAGLVNTK